MDEHARYGMFENQLKRAKLDNLDVVEKFISLALEEPDHGARGAMLGLIATDPTIDSSMLGFLTQHSAFSEEFLQKILARRQLFLALETQSLSEDLFRACISFQHNGVHRKLLSLPGLTQDQLRVLCENGVNKAVRNIARERLKRESPGVLA